MSETRSEIDLQSYHDRQAKLYKALSLAQREFLPIKRTNHVFYKTKDGRVVDYWYAPLEEIIRCTTPALSKNGLATYQVTEPQGDRTLLTCVLAHEEGGTLESKALLPSAFAIDIKELGGKITYNKRYLTSGLLGVAFEDDVEPDGDPERSGDIPQTQPEQMPSVGDALATDNMKEWVAKRLAEKKMSFEAACGLAKLPLTTSQSKLTKAEFQALRGALSAPEIQ